MEYQWKGNFEPDTRKVQHLSNVLNVSDKIAALLVQRGIESYEEAEAFFVPNTSNLHNPFLMKGMQNAVERTANAIKNKEKILIYGDYDVDGTTSVATVYSFLKNIADVEYLDYYIPDRYKEGYGVSKIGIEWAKQNEFSLIIALDCGTRSVELIQYAKDLGIDFIVCDHHLPGETLPNAVAILNPKQSDCPYPYKELSGCGIGFKFNQALAEYFNLDPKRPFKNIDLVAVSIASDIVDMMGENRILMQLGLRKLNEDPCVGLQALMQSYTLKENYDVSDIVFGLGPRINASGRISDAKDSVKLLIETNFHEAIKFAKLLNEHNSERKDKDSEITNEALQMLENDASFVQRKATVIFGKNWHKGVIGIVASRLIETHYKPTIVFTEIDGMLTGSARSVKDFDIHDAIGACSEFVVQYGGHKYAAGLSVRATDYENFATKFEKVVQNTLPPHAIMPQINYDLEIELTEISEKFLRILDRFKPYGPGNMTPIFRANNLKDSGFSKILKEKHLRVSALQSGVKFDGIGFGMANFYEIVKYKNFDTCFSLEWNEFNGYKNIQLKIRDIKACN